MFQVTASRNPHHIKHFHTLVFGKNANMLKKLTLFTLWKNMGGIPPKNETQAKLCSQSLEGGPA